jgi:antitoxin (DNA-binding transcriptional repressor) of toxin-antitoxin stability system
MYHMKTASIRQVRHDFSRVLEWVENGEEVAITKRHQTVARLLPARRKRTPLGRMPDVTARLRKVFGTKVIPKKVMQEIWEENRRSY